MKMIELSVHNVMKFFGANKIFENISFDVKTGERIGFIGQNGCGKTTMMKIIMGIEDCQEGEITLRKGAKVGYLNQIPVFDEETTTMDVIHMAFDKVYQIKRQMKELEVQFAKLTGEQLEKALASYGKLSEQFEVSGGYDIETRVNKVTEGLLISESMEEMLFEQLSGGEKTRVMLAKILLEEPDILLLDEPTNHLDLEAIEWLEGFLKDYKGSVLVISHDRYFLDSVVNKIIELQYDSAELYLGNYSYYIIEKERRFLQELKNYENQQKKIERMEQQIERYRIWGVMRDSDAMFRKAKVIEKRLEKIDVLDRPVLQKRKISLTQSHTARTGKIVFEIQELNKSFGEKVLLKDGNLTVFYQDSACIIGKNGCGKSTLLKMILGELEPDSGTVKIGAQVTVGYLAQNVVYEDEEQTVLEYFARLHNLTQGEARAQLAKVLFMKEDVNKKIRTLSGGEKSRLRLCSLTFEGVNVLVLDEPTNHLDIDSREVLEKTLMEFEGTILIVSHDRYFINKIADRIISLDQGELKLYRGDYSYYQEELKKEKFSAGIENENTAEKKVPVTNVKSSYREVGKEIKKTTGSCVVEKPVLSSYAMKKLEQLETLIEELEQRKKTFEEDMLLHGSNAEMLEKLFEENERNNKDLEEAYEQWESYKTV
jgi:ATP-binding cassette, subfamily F, member 3